MQFSCAVLYEILSQYVRAIPNPIKLHSAFILTDTIKHNMTTTTTIASTVVPLIATGLTAAMSVFMVFTAALNAESFAIEVSSREELEIAKEHAPKLTAMALAYITLYNLVQAIVNCFIFVMILNKGIPAKLVMTLHLAYWIACGLAVVVVQPWPSMDSFQLLGVVPITDGTILAAVWFLLSLAGYLTAVDDNNGGKKNKRS